VLEGELGALPGDEVVSSKAGDFVFKPRIQWHTFWNAGATPCRILEIIAPGAFEGMFTDMGEWTERSALEEVRALNAKYGLDEKFEKH